MLRDVLANEIPTVLRGDLYALAALTGAATVVIGDLLHIHPVAATTTGGVLCFAVRVMAIRYGWHLPTAERR
jgi:uncharacterized membrane protein YeiH